MKPKILLSTSRDDPRAYVDMIRQCGAEPFPCYCPTYDTKYDALLLCGGCDLDPCHYGEQIDGSVNLEPQRDAAEMQLIKDFLSAGKPIFGICRGFQLLNVYFGGSLWQHMPNASIHAPAVEGNYLAHGAIARENTPWQALYGDRFPVNSHHHQAVKKLASCLEVTITDDTGTVVEGFRHKQLPIVAVQFHPEKMCFSFRRPDTVDGSIAAKYFIDVLRRSIDIRQG